MSAPRASLNKATHSVGFQAKLVTVKAITADGLHALTVDRLSTENQVPMLVQRSKAALPQVGETWLIDQALGNWTFAAFVGTAQSDFSSVGSTTGPPVFGAGQHIYVQGAAPASPNSLDLWVNTALGDQLLVFRSGAWQVLQWGTEAYADASITEPKLAFTIPSGGLPADGPAATYTFVSGDIADPASFYGANPVKILGTWTPSASGTLVLIPPSDNSDPDYSNFTAYIWQGTTANTDYPDTTAGSGGFTGGFSVVAYGGQAPPPSAMFVTAGQDYTVIIVDYTGSAGGVMELDGLLNSLYPFSGEQIPVVSQVPPAMPPGWSTAIGLLPDGSALCRRPVWIDNQVKGNPGGVGTGTSFSATSSAAAGDFSFAANAGGATGQQSAAFGSAGASGQMSFAEGGAIEASGDRSHAEGDLTIASAYGSHAQGGSTIAAGDWSHAEGLSAYTAQPGESALGGGALGSTIAGTPNAHRLQASRFVTGTQTTGATPSPLLTGVGPGPAGTSLTLTDNFLTLIKGWIAAVDTSGAVAKTWEVSATIVVASGTPRLVGSVTKTVLAADAGASTWDVTITAAATDPIKVTGQASTTINWSAHLMLLEAPNP